jgi:murein DD-endopeptidase MepM/ murein hydrolase activator NlpD
MYVNRRLGCFSCRVFLCFLLVVFLFAGCSGTSKGRRRSSYTRFRHRDGVFHTVRRGETLWRIAKTYKVRLDDLVSVNRIADPARIRVGQRIFIPTAKRSLPVRSASTRKSKRSPKLKFIWPVKGKLISGYGYQGGIKNDGIDIAAPANTDVLAAHSGRVIYADNKMQYYGNMIIIKHQDQYFTVYAHNSVNLVNANQWVTPGQVIGRVGSTGRASSPRLHFEIRYGEKAVDPLAYLP